jgi:phospholipid/cholesterol/gamma-HCH transport system substrate-binding protein
MRAGAEIKVGIITVVAVALLAVYLFYLQGYRAAARTYTICVLFDNARGLQRGDPVRMVGVKIGEVALVRINDALKAEATLKIERKYDLYDNYQFQIATSGLIQERFVEVVPTDRTPWVVKLKPGVCVQGVLQPGLGELMVQGAQLLENLNRTSRGINVLLSEQQILRRVEDALDSFSAAADAAAKLAATTAQLAEQSQPSVLGTLRDLSAAAADMQSTASELRAKISGPMLTDLEHTMRAAGQTADNAERISASLANLVSDPQLQLQIKESVAAIHDAALSARQMGEDLRTFSGEVRKAAPVVPKAAHEVEQLAGTAETLRERLKPPQINAAFDILSGPEESRWFSSGRLDLQTQPDRFFRVGMDDIGEESNVTVQLGERHGRRVLRYGLYRSRLGAGLDLDVASRTMLSLDLFDPNDLRADLLADISAVPGRSDLSLLLGARDIGQDAVLVAGVRLKR